MENFSWLNAFREMGARVRRETFELVTRSGAGTPIGTGASGDTTLAIDKRAEDAIISVLEEARVAGEEFYFISEELGEKDYGNKDAVVLADPIDGSNNAKYGLPFYSTALALATGRKLSDVVLGYIMNMATGEEYWAMKGGGAYKDGMKLTTSRSAELGMLNFECSNPVRDLSVASPLLMGSRKIRCLGSTALDMACLASGSTDAVLIPSPSRSFDYAAGWLLVREAGGVVTDTSGLPLDETHLGVERTRPVLAASNAKLHEVALNRLKVPVNG